MKVLFLVNGSRESADGIRAISLARYFPQSWAIQHEFREETNKWRSFFSFLRQAIAEKPDVIVVIKMAYSGVLAGILAKYLTGSRLICDTGDVAYALAKSTGRYSRTEQAVIWVVERIGSHLSDWIVTRGTYHKEVLADWNVKNVTVIPDGVETAIEVPRDGKRIREQLGLTGTFVVGIVGSMEWSDRYGICYGWDLIEALKYLQDLPVVLLLVGDGNGRARLEARVAELGAERLVRFVGRKPYEELADYLGAMDICVSTQSNDLVGMVRTTGKLPLYLAHDKYIIATDVGEAHRVLQTIGTLLPYEGVKDSDHPQRLAYAIRHLVETPSRLQMSGAARNLAVAEFDYEMLGKRLQEVIQEVIQAPGTTAESLAR